MLKSKKGKKGKKKLDSDEENELYKNLLAGSSENSDYDEEVDGSDEERNEAHIEEMRKKLLDGLSKDYDHRSKKDI